MDIVRQWRERNDQSIRVVAFGSSNTEKSWSSHGRNNWVDWLTVNLRAHGGTHINVINQGISGETTVELLGRIERDVFSYNPALVMITIGGNDAKNLQKNISLQRYTDNLRKLCSDLRSRDVQVVLQTYYCPMYHLGPDGFREKFESYMEANRILAKEMSLLLVDQYKQFEPMYTAHPEAYGQLMRDWIHVNPFGNLLMGQHVSRAFGLPELQIPEDIKEEFEAILSRLEYSL